MHDDGRHFDGDSGDGIYASYDAGPLEAFTYFEYLVDVQFDTIGLARSVYEVPVGEVPQSPRILTPTSNPQPTLELEIACYLPSSRVGKVLLMPGFRETGATPDRTFWKDSINTSLHSGFSRITVPILLSNGSEYSVVLWNHSGGTVEPPQRPVYGLDIVNFVVDTNVSELLVFELAPSFPNPFNAITVVQWRQAERSAVSLSIYDILGKEVRTLTGTELYSPGLHSLVWDGRDEKGVGVSAGTYILRGTASGLSQTLKLVLLR